MHRAYDGVAEVNAARVRIETGWELTPRSVSRFCQSITLILETWNSLLLTRVNSISYKCYRHGINSLDGPTFIAMYVLYADVVNMVIHRLLFYKLHFSTFLCINVNCCSDDRCAMLGGECKI